MRLSAPSPERAQAFAGLFEAHPPVEAARDLLFVEATGRSGRALVDLRPARDGAARHWALRIYALEQRPLDEIMPLLKNLRMRVIDQEQTKAPVDGGACYIRNFLVEPFIEGLGRLSGSRRPLRRMLDVLLAGEAEDDALNGLALLAGLDWREVDLLRAYCNYYLQLDARFGRSRIHQALLRNRDATRLLKNYFAARFELNGRWANAEQRELEALGPVRLQLISCLDAVSDVNDDRILRDLFNLIDATLRTNFYSSTHSRCIAFKIGGLGVINMPSPKPMAEIYVHARMMEGVHLRGAKVARGGIRWSDRPDDFRSEILSLMQTQTVKNALIAPQGAKGGFILKTIPSDPAERQKRGEEAYDTLIRGLLDLTDNVEVAARTPWLVAYDEFDPYLVVAADKGTAAWSDRANAIAEEYHFWLGDAFATGGSHGYHHKRLGITARGAWICVARHFRELGRDLDAQACSVVGVGSMDGDVFGNGMLQSSNIRLLGAFSGQHIFIDPNPDALLSYAERRRLFELPNSSWGDYDRSVISQGGGVFRRDDKTIPVSPEMRAWLGARGAAIDGDGLVRLLLTAPVDLMWMGGVGAYIKASSETNESVGDRANDGVRVDASVVRATVIGEGANLAVTQRGRVEYALKGGRIDTDALDNSAGVDLSDHEVNLKILLGPPVNAQAAEERNRLLDSFTDEVCAVVLDNNYRQSLCLSLERERCRTDVSQFLYLADQFENAGVLDRSLEAFPTRKEVLARPARDLMRPELAVLMAYAKLALKRALLETGDFLDGAWAKEHLAAYFPKELREIYAERLLRHSLAREIAATMITNRVIDHAGAGFLLFGDGLTPGLLAQAVGVYLAFDDILEGDRWRDAVRALDGQMPASRQYEYLLQLENALMFLTRWALRRGRRFTPQKELVVVWRAFLKDYLAYFSGGAEFAVLSSTAPDASRQLFLDRLRDFPVLVELSQAFRESLRGVAQLFDAIADFFGLRQIMTLIGELAPRDSWERRLQVALEERLRAAGARFVAMQLRLRQRQPMAFFRQIHMEHHLTRVRRLRAELVEVAVPTLAAVAAFVAELDALVDACAAVIDERTAAQPQEAQLFDGR